MRNTNKEVFGKDIQERIGYTFHNSDLLRQAFIRKSYTNEHGGAHNEVLEFIGDKALDLAVIRIMMERFGRFTQNGDHLCFETTKNEGSFTDIKKDLVAKGALSSAMETLGFHERLIMGGSDIKGNMQDQPSVKEDLFEAIIGAVALDCNWNMDKVTDTVRHMIDLEDYFQHTGVPGGNYINMLQEWTQARGLGLPSYQCEEAGDTVHRCILTMPEKLALAPVAALGKNKKAARMAAAKIMCDHLQLTQSTNTLNK